MLVHALGIVAVLGISTPPAKCPTMFTLPDTPPGQSVVVIDGRIAPSSESIDHPSIHSLSVTCWNPESDEIHAEKGLTFVHIVTTVSATQAEDALEAFASAYAAFRAEFGVRPESAEQLVPFGISEVERYDYSADDGSAAVSVSDAHEAYRCTLDLARTDARSCEVDFTGARRILRAAWEAGTNEGLAQGAGVYEVRLDLEDPSYADFQGVLALAPHPIESSPRMRNGCFSFKNRPDEIDGREFYPGIREVGLTLWSETPDSVQVPVYRSPDASATLLGVWSEDGFRGHVSQFDWDGSRSGPWLPFSAVRVGPWGDDVCAELLGGEILGRLTDPSTR